MKKILSILLLTLMVNISMAEYDSTPIQFEELPEVSQKFLKKYFNIFEFTTITKTDNSYSIRFGNTAQVDFDYFGEWTEILTFQEGGVPIEIIPKKILKYLDKEVKGGHYVMQIERSIEGYDIDLENGLELSFTSKFTLKK